ncbi:hypothetical protein [Cytobacillus sp. IB215316]|uniref:hypothetical protein n=1 Tax=Cytobacillus sp. IB215316 TaxID=3097354 RepID=UPI002A0AC78E|nr:hypothetical protein [Cytobacillus sp. IB215316]MDX8360775.1 hypothetical protein [Cytobacillus sp. IB215316]
MSISDIFYLTFSIITSLYVLIIPKGMLTTKIYMNCSKVDSMTMLQRIECYIPVRNSYIIKKSLNEKAPFLKILSNVFVILLLITIFIRLFFPVTDATQSYVIIQLTCTMMMIIVLSIIYIVEVIILWELSDLFEIRSHKLWSVILPPFCSFLLTYKVDPYFIKMESVIDRLFATEQVK